MKGIHSTVIFLIGLTLLQTFWCQRTTPFTADEYVKLLGFGFDTDFFKSSPPLANYNNPNNRIMNDLKSIGVGHLRLRSRADLLGYQKPTFDSVSMNKYLTSLKVIMNDMIKVGIFPVISWIHDEAESLPTAKDGDNYVNWWKKLAEVTTTVTYELSFNLFTEINDGPLRDVKTYNDWTQRAIKAIRETGGYNAERIIILGAPGKKSDSLFNIYESIYQNKKNIVVEWHLYASGPDKDGSQKNWAGTGSVSDKQNVDSVMDEAVRFSVLKKTPSWIGAWMPYDNLGGSQNQNEVEAFGCYFAKAAFKRGIPWAMNKLENFYDTKKNVFIQTESIGRNGNKVTVNIKKALEAALCGIKDQNQIESTRCTTSCNSKMCKASNVTRTGYIFTCNCSACPNNLVQKGKHLLKPKTNISKNEKSLLYK